MSTGTLLTQLAAFISVLLFTTWIFLHRGTSSDLSDGKLLNRPRKSELNIISRNPNYEEGKTVEPYFPSESSSKIETVPESISAKMETKLHTVTYASHGGKDDRFCRAVESAIRHDFDLVILGWGVKWRGLSQKLEAAHAFAMSLPPNDLILFTDAFDVLFTDSSSAILSKYKEGEYGLLFSAECGCWPHVIEDKSICFTKYPPSPTPYRYLNSGTWIGRADMAKDMLAKVIELAGNNFANANDQKLVADMFISGKSNISLDYHNKIFQAMHMTLDPPLARCFPHEDLQLTSDGHWKNIKTNSIPAVIHFNGGGKQFHLQMESKVWYKQKEHNTRDKLQELAEHELIVPTQASGKLKFKSLCSDYVMKLKKQHGVLR